VEPPPSALNMTLPAFAALSADTEPAAGAVLQAPALSSEPAGRRCCCRSMGQTDGRADARPLHRPCSAYDAGSVNKATSVLSCRKLDAVHSTAPRVSASGCCSSRTARHHTHTVRHTRIPAVGPDLSCPGPPQLRGLDKNSKKLLLKKT